MKKEMKEVKIYKKKNEEGLSFVLEIGENKIVLSNPMKIKYETEDSYFYYTIEIFKDNNFLLFDSLNRDKNEKLKHDWKLIAKKNIYEDGMIESVPSMINKLLNVDLTKNYHYKEILYNQKKPIGYDSSYQLSCYGFEDEDIIKINKQVRFINDGNKYTEFDMFIGIGVFRNYIGVFASRLTKQDIILVKRWAKDFLSYADKISVKE